MNPDRNRPNRPCRSPGGPVRVLFPMVPYVGPQWSRTANGSPRGTIILDRLGRFVVVEPVPVETAVPDHGSDAFTFPGRLQRLPCSTAISPGPINFWRTTRLPGSRVPPALLGVVRQVLSRTVTVVVGIDAPTLPAVNLSTVQGLGPIHQAALDSIGRSLEMLIRYKVGTSVALLIAQIALA